MNTLHKLTSEFLGTMFIVLIGCGAAVISSSAIGTLGICFSFGLALSVAHYITAPISGGHLNPAVSFAFWLLKKINLKEFLSYGIAQLLGAAVAGALLYILMIWISQILTKRFIQTDLGLILQEDSPCLLEAWRSFL